MSFKKTVLVLKCTEKPDRLNGKTLGGIARIETENGVGELHLSLINIPVIDDGEYFSLIIDAKKNQHFFPLGKRPTSSAKIFDLCPNTDGGIAVGIYYVKNGIPSTVAFAQTERFSVCLSDFKRAVAEKCLLEHKQTKKKVEPEEPIVPPVIEPPYPPPISPDPTQTPSSPINTAYDDEAVATENYYRLDQSIESRLNLLKECDNGNLQFENELSATCCKEETAKIGADAYPNQNETDANLRKEDKPNTAYYFSVKAELNDIFYKFPAEENLKKIFPTSEWAKINYSDQKYYVVGLVKEDGKEKYICYGVPADYAPEPPKELKGYCSFIPLSLFDMKGKGYWMMFQDATTGKCVHL